MRLKFVLEHGFLLFQKQRKTVKPQGGKQTTGESKPLSTIMFEVFGDGVNGEQDEYTKNR
jgi:hypothetical protein